MPDIARFTLRLRPTHPDTIPALTARAAHAWYLDSLRQIQPELSAAIHDGHGHKPLTTSGLLPVPRGELLYLHPGQPLSLMITTLHHDLTQLTLNVLVSRWLQHGLCLHDQPFRVESIETLTADYAELLNRYVPDGYAGPGRQLTFTFTSPTMFKKTGDLQMPLPLPEYVFGSLMDRWLAFSDVPMPEEKALREFVATHMVIDSHRIRTQEVFFAHGRRGRALGFLGDVSFRALSGEAPYLGWLHALTDFAVFSGVGAKTTMGMGRVEHRPVRQSRMNGGV